MIAKIMTFLVLLFLIIPIIILIPVSLSPTSYVVFPNEDFSLKWYQELFSDPTWLGAIQNSLKIGILTAICALLLGITVVLGMRQMGKKMNVFFGEYFRLPQSIPIIVSAIAIYALLNSMKLTGTLPGLVIAHTVVALPFVVTTLKAAISGIDENLEMAAINLGADKVKAFLHITLPMLKSSLISAALFAFLTSFDEIAITLFITGPSVETLPKKMYDGISQVIKPTLAAMSTILVSLIIFGFIIAGIIQIRNEKQNSRQ